MPNCCGKKKSNILKMYILIKNIRRNILVLVFLLTTDCWLTRQQSYLFGRHMLCYGIILRVGHCVWQVVLLANFFASAVLWEHWGDSLMVQTGSALSTLILKSQWPTGPHLVWAERNQLWWANLGLLSLKWSVENKAMTHCMCQLFSRAELRA